MEQNAVQKAVAIAGGQSSLARMLKVRPQAVQKWCSSGLIPANRVIEVEKAVCGAVNRTELRPDLYPAEQICAFNHG